MRLRKLLRQQLFEFAVALAFGCGKRKHGNSKPLRKEFIVNFLLLCFRNVHHIEQQHGRLLQRSKFRRHIHASFQLRSVRQYAHQIGVARFYVISCDYFLVGVSGQTVAARKVGHGVFYAVIGIMPFVFLNGLARPVSDVLTGTRQSVVDGRLAGIRLS